MIHQQVEQERVRALAEQAEKHLAHDDAAAALVIAAQAVVLDPTDSHAQAQHGQALMRLGRPLEAASAFLAALVTNPEIPALHLLLGNAYRAAGDNHLAAIAYGEAVQRASDMGGAWRNFGLALLGTGDVGRAVKALRRACALEPDAAAGWNSLGAALHATGAPHQALCAFTEAARLASVTCREGARARWNQSLLYLLTGDMTRGWSLHAYRRTGPLGGHTAPFGLPVIAGRPSAGMRVLVTIEQGLGDVVMVLRFLPLLAQEGVHIILQRPEPFRRILTAFPGVESFLDDGMPVPDVDGVLHCMTLPSLFVANDQHVPGTVPYLRPDPALAARWEKRLAGTQGLRVGFVWAGNPDYALDRDRSPGLQAMLPLMSMAGIDPVCLQVGPGRRDLATIPLPPGAIDLGAEVTDLADTLAILSCVDLLVSCCTMPAHLAGAAGVPTFILIPAVPDWRWGLGRTSSPWYPSVTLFRQEQPSDWSTPLANVARDLSKRIGSRACR